MLQKDNENKINKACGQQGSSKKMKRNWTFILRKGQLKFPGHIMRKQGLENLTITGQIDGKRSREKQ